MKTCFGILKTWLFILLFALAGARAHGQPDNAGSAISCNGTDGFLSLPDGIWFDSNFTVEAWVDVASYNSWSRLIDFSDGAANENVYLALTRSTTGYPTMGVFDGGGGPLLIATNQLPLGQWAHLAATMDNGTATIYINGQIAGQAAGMDMPPAVVRTEDYIGRSPYAADSYAHAVYDELRIWNVARTQNEIQTSMQHSLIGTETGLLGYWRFDEGGGTSALDSTGNSHTATLNGGASWTNSGALITNSADYALAFAASAGESVSIPHMPAQNAYPLTVMCWFLSPTNTGGGGLINKYYSGSANGWQLAMGSQLHAWYYRDGSDFVGNTGAGAVDDGKWHQGAFVVDAAGGHIYVDGVLKSTVAWTGTAGPSTTSQPISLGLYPGDSFYTGDIDEVSIWNTNLSASEIQTYMDQPLQGTEPGLLAYYRLNEGIGTNIYDYSTNLNTGTFGTAGPTWVLSGEKEESAPSIDSISANVTFTNVTLNASVNPNDSSTFVWFIYGLSTNYGATNFLGEIGSGFNSLAVSDVLTNLPLTVSGLSYHYTVIAYSAAGTTYGNDATFHSEPATPVVTNLPADVTFTNVTLSASVIPNRLDATVWFVYGLTTNYGTTNLLGDFSSGYNPFTVQEVLSNLPPETIYHYNVIASNAFGIVSGADLTFETDGGPPLVEVEPPNITFTNVTLNALVNPNLETTTVWFAYGATPGYGTTNFIANLGTGFNNFLLSDLLSNLPTHTKYYYTCIASNAFGVASAGINTFETSGYLLGATSLLEGPASGSDSVVLGGVPSGQPWTATSTAAWLHLNSYTNGVGSQNVIFTFDQNPGSPRTGAINFGSQAVTITQAGATYIGSSAVLNVASSTNDFGSLALDGGGSLYFSDDAYTYIQKSDYLTKSMTEVYSGPENCYSFGIDAATNIYFFQDNAEILNLPFGAGVPSLYLPTPEISTLLVAPSGDLFYSSDYAHVYSLPKSADSASLLFTLDTNVFFPSWGVDAADNLYLLLYTNSIAAGAVYEWSAVNSTLKMLFTTYSNYRLAVDASGNVYVSDYSYSGIDKWHAATGALTLEPPASSPAFMAVDNWGDVYSIEYGSPPQAGLIYENLRAYVNAKGIVEPAAAGTDSIAPALPATTYLGGNVAPFSSAPWLTVNGVTNGVITFSFSAFSGPGNRTAYLNVLGVSIPVTQGGTTVSLGAESTVEGHSAGTDSIVIALTPSSGNWTAAANNSWLHLTNSMQSGVGGTAIVFSFDENPGPTRTGSLTVADQTFTVTQTGASYVQITNLTELGSTTSPITALAVGSEGNVFGSTYQVTNGIPYEGLWEWIAPSNATAPMTVSPFGVKADWLGNIYVNVNSDIEQYNPITGTFNSILYQPYQYTIESFVVDLAGDIIFVNGNSGNLTEYVPATEQFETLATGPFGPFDMTVDPAGNVFWIEGGQSVMEWNAGSLSVSVVLSNVSANSIAVDPADNLYLMHYAGFGYELQEISHATGLLSTPPVPGLVDSSGVAVDSLGNVYVATDLTTGDSVIYEIPRAFVDRTPRIENLAGGQDALPPVLPTSENLLPPFAPASNQPWLTISGVHNGVVGFSLSPSATPRLGTITLLGQTILVSQGTNTMLGTGHLLEGPWAGADSFVFGAIPADASWTASANVPWLHIPAAGVGGGDVIFTNDPNPGATRSGTITIAGQTLTVTQAGTTYVQASPPTILASGANGLGAPCGVALDGSDNVYIADTYNNAFKVWNPTNDQITVLSTNGFDLPYALAVDASGNVYIADTYNNVLKRWSPATSNMTTVVPNLAAPFGVAVDSAGNVYISDTGNNAIKKWFPGDSNIVTLYYNPNSQPVGVAVDAIGNVYWLEGGTGSVREWSPIGGNVTTLFSTNYSQPYGVAVDVRGNVYACDYNGGETYEWIAASNKVTLTTGNILGIAVDANGNVFAADPYDSLIYERPRAFVDPTPRIESLAGGQDALPPLLPVNEDLLPPFAPTAGLPWVTITSLTNDIVDFSFTSSSSARTNEITVYGQAIPIIQGNTVVPPEIVDVKLLGPGILQFSLTNGLNESFTVLASSSLSLPILEWTVVGATTNISAGVYQFTDSQATNAERFYRVRSP